jgi:SAM-dependent methyltransferase
MNQNLGHDPIAGKPPSPAAEYDPAAYWSKRLADGESLEAVGWQGLGRSFNGWLYRRRAAVFRQVARSYGFDRRPPAVLDLGPGTGFYVDLWSRLGVRELTGIDIAPPAVARLRRRFPTYQFLSGDIGRPMALPPHAFDVVTAFDVLFHLTDEAAFDQALSSIVRALRPGGIVLITDLFPETQEIRLPHHVSRTAGRYREALAAVGLDLDQRRPVFVLMHPWSEPRTDASRRTARAWWSIVERVAGHVPGAGAPLGASLYALDTMLAPFVGPGPSTQLWALRRSQQ